MTNNLAYCLAVEKLLGLEIPERAQYLRVLLNELTRVQSYPSTEEKSCRSLSDTVKLTQYAGEIPATGDAPVPALYVTN